MTLALFSPKPTGVSRGPFRTTRVRSIDSRVAFGTPDVSPRLKTSAPASASSHSMATPAAAMIRCADRTTSGPTPSPGMTVIRCGWAVIGANLLLWAGSGGGGGSAAAHSRSGRVPRFCPIRHAAGAYIRSHSNGAAVRMSTVPPSPARTTAAYNDVATSGRSFGGSVNSTR